MVDTNQRPYSKLFYDDIEVEVENMTRLRCSHCGRIERRVYYCSKSHMLLCRRCFRSHRRRTVT